MSEWYARGMAKSKSGMELHPGVQIKFPEDDVTAMLKQVKGIAVLALAVCPDDHEAAVRYAEKIIQRNWPDRAYFIETDRDDMGVQVYNPKGFVKTKCTCPCTRADAG